MPTRGAYKYGRKCGYSKLWRHSHDTGRQIKTASLFTEYRIQSNSNNEIHIQVSIEALLAALRSASATTGQGSTFASEETQVLMK